MNKLDESKKLLEMALRKLPYNVSLSSIRIHIQRALFEITKENVEKPQPKQKIADPQLQIMASINPHKSLEMLEKMIKEERDKINSLTQPTDTQLND